MRSVRMCGVLAIAATVALTAACSCCGTASGGGGGGGNPTGAQTTPVTLTWWHNGTTDPAQTVWQQVADAYHAAHPNVSFKISPMQNEAVQDQDPGCPAGQRPARHLPAMGRRRAGHPGRSPASSMDITQAVAPGSASSARCGEGLAGRRQAVRHALRPAHRRLLVPHRPVRPGRHHRTADHDGRAQRRRHEAEGRRHRADRDRQQGQVARRVLVGVLRHPRVPDGHAS